MKKPYVAFPKCVYGKTLDDCVIINSEEERPEGYRNYEEVVGLDTTPDEGKSAVQTAADELKSAEAAFRAGITDYLDENDVDYDVKLSTPKLEEIKVALDIHLAAQEPEGDDS